MRDQHARICRMGAFALALAGATAAASCTDPVEHEFCGNWIDDNGNLLIDCEDPECYLDPACLAADGDADVDRDADVDGDGGGDGDADTDADTDHDGDVDGDVDGDIDEAPCDPARETCVAVCSSDDDCVLALDMMECCGGFPHDVSGVTVACPTAVHRERVEQSECVVPWAAGDPLPTVPETCAPWCGGLTCSECPDLVRAACNADGVCVGIGSTDGCADDGDCADGSSCVDPDHDGVLQCVEGSHECATSADCGAAHPTCSMCDCMDIDGDALRECACYGCDDIECFQDLDCALHYFCDGGLCTFGGNRACRIGGGAIECGDCEVCEPSDSNPERGRCVRDPAC